MFLLYNILKNSHYKIDLFQMRSIFVTVKVVSYLYADIWIVFYFSYFTKMYCTTLLMICAF